MQRYARYVRHDLRDLNPVIGVNRRLDDRAYIGATMLAAIGQDVAPLRRVRMQGSVGSGMGRGLRLRLALAAGLVPLARRRRGVPRRLRREVQPLTQRRVLRDQRIDPSQQRTDQSILLG